MSNPRPLCIYHGNCADGFTAAWAVWKRFGDAWDYYPGVYQNEPPDVTGRDVVLVDFSYKRDVLKAMARSARSILVLDHHKTASVDLWDSIGATDDDPFVRRLNVMPLWEEYVEQVAKEDGRLVYRDIYAYFDMESSGAAIAWDFFHPDARRPRLTDFVEDRDLWRFSLTGSREVSAYIFSHHYDFQQWERLAAKLEADLPGAIAEGAAIERKHHKDVTELVAAFRSEMVIGGHWVPVANLPYTLTSDAGHLMCQPYASPNLQGEIVTPPFAACYWDTAEGRVFSLRSVEDGADVSEIAKQYGGGGHKHAAGFRLPHGVSP